MSKKPRKLSAGGRALLQTHEGFCAEPVRAGEAGWLVGYGHISPKRCKAISEAEAADLFAADVAPIEAAVNDAVTAKLSQAQFDALVSFAFSIGAEAFRSSQVLRRVNADDFVAAACAMEAWRKIEIDGEARVSEALVRRRAIEKAQLLRDVKLQALASAVHRPLLDYAASVLGAPLSEDMCGEPQEEAVAHDIGQIISNVLMAEEPTRQVLLAPAPILEVAVTELVTAHAKPNARQAFQETAHAVRKRALSNKYNRETVSLLALLVFGVSLVLGAGSIALGRNFDLVEAAGAAALAAPGLAAIFIASVGLTRTMRSPPLRGLNARAAS